MHGFRALLRSASRNYRARGVSRPARAPREMARRQQAREGGGKFVTNSFVSSTPQNEQLERKRFQTATRRWWCAAEERYGESRRDGGGKRAKRSIRVCETFSAAVCLYAASARVANPAHLYERAPVRVKLATVCGHRLARARARTREYKVLFSKFMIVNKF